MRIIVVDNGTAHLKELLKMLKTHDVDVVARADFHAKRIPIGAVVILSGAGKGNAPVLRHDDIYKRQLILARDHTGPVIGICLGMEIIAHAYGAALHKRKRRIHRLVRVRRVSTSLAAFLPDTFLAYVAHRYAVQNLARTKLVALAWSNGGVEVLRHKKKPIFGIQFHPEVRLGANGGRKAFEKILLEIQSELHG